MRYLITTILLFIFTWSVDGQVDNPFEIYRNGSVIEKPILQEEAEIPHDTSKTTVPPSVDVQEESKNIFDVSRKAEEVTIDEEPPEMNQALANIQDTSIIEQIQEEVASSNPFDIDKQERQEGQVHKDLTNEIEAPVTVEKPKIIEKLPLSGNKSSSFPFWVGLFCIIIIAIIINLNKSFVPRLINSITNDNILKQNMRNDNGGLNILYLSVYLVFILEFSLFVYLYINIKISQIDISTWWLTLFVVLAGVLSKHLFLFVIGKIFHLEKIFNEYSFTILTYNIIFGIFLVPLTLLIAYGPTGISSFLILGSIIIGLILAGFCYLRSILSLGSYIKSNILHFFLYLCTFEIVPILVLVKITLNIF